LLKLCGYDVDVLDAGCCGMAGTFGYETEHYELSMKVGERLFWEMKKHELHNVIVAGTGAACRMQMIQGAGVDAVHPIILVLRAVANNYGLP